MSLDEDALPLHEDALFKIRPRLFLEGNYFIDVQPGSPSAPVVDEGHSFPVNRTSHSVQLDQVLTTLQSDVRTDLQTLLQEFGCGAERPRRRRRPARSSTGPARTCVLGAGRRVVPRHAGGRPARDDLGPLAGPRRPVEERGEPLAS